MSSGQAGKRGRAWRRRAALAAGALCLAGAATTAALAEHGVDQSMEVAWSGLGAERVKSIPIAKRKGAKPRVVMSLPPEQVGGVNPGDAVYANAEVEVSVTCLEPMPKCVGKIYHFSPYYRARLVLGGGPGAARPDVTTPISEWRRQRCSQELPHRNHHCVLALDGTRQIADGDSLPCAPRCHVNLVVEAYHEKAKRGNVLVIGSDDDDGIEQDKGTVNSAVWDPGPKPGIDPVVSRRTTTRKIPVASQSGAGKVGKVVMSRRLNNLEAGEQFLVDARVKVKTGHLPYGTLIQSQLILSEKPGSTKRSGNPGKIASSKGMITAQNGFNCTRGRSGHTSPCTVRKLGVVKIFKDSRTRPEQGEGPFVPLYVNLVLQSKAEYGGERHRAGEVAKVKRRGNTLAITRFGPEFRR
jgi:hypothetical protein